MRILFVGDVFGHAGRRIVGEHLRALVAEQQVDLLVINAENSAGGFGVTPATADELFELGAHVLTTGNHVWDKREIIDYMQSATAGSHDQPRRLLRPANYVEGSPGFGWYEGRLASGQTYAVINLQGRRTMTLSALQTRFWSRLRRASSLWTSTLRRPVKKPHSAGTSMAGSPRSWVRTRMYQRQITGCCQVAQPTRPMLV